MAGYKTHLSFGVGLGIAAVAVASGYALVSDNRALALVFACLLIGSFLPDLDSDEGAPFRLLINIFSCLAAVLSFTILKEEGVLSVWKLALVPIAFFLVFRFAIGGILKKFTRHRGIFHSLPAAALAGLLTYEILDRTITAGIIKTLAALGVSLGYGGHLLLDELKSATALNGAFLRPSRSLGSAFKLTADSTFSTIAIYLILLYFFWQFWPLGLNPIE